MHGGLGTADGLVGRTGRGSAGQGNVLALVGVVAIGLAEGAAVCGFGNAGLDGKSTTNGARGEGEGTKEILTKTTGVKIRELKRY